MPQVDVLIVGAGIAGASLAAALAPHARVLVLEAEDHPGMHSTGRSAAFFAETYGGPRVQPLTSASRAFFQSPPPGFTDGALLRPRGALHVTDGDGRALDGMLREFADAPVTVDPLSPDGIAARFPHMRKTWRQHGLWEPACRDIDVAALHAGYLRLARQGGVIVESRSALLSATRRDGRWVAKTLKGSIGADIIVNSAGAWADDVAARCGVSGIGIKPLRRTIIAAEIDIPVDNDWPLVVDAAGTFYFKPDAGRMWISPHDEIPDTPRDVQPEELDIAVAVDRFERATTARVRRIERSWAGLRSFAADRLPVYGYDPAMPGFFWCSGQGGFGIQTAPAAAELAAAGVLRSAYSGPVDPEPYAAARFR